jgi:hypothetical protein
MQRLHPPPETSLEPNGGSPRRSRNTENPRKEGQQAGAYHVQIPDLDLWHQCPHGHHVSCASTETEIVAGHWSEHRWSDSSPILTLLNQTERRSELTRGSTWCCSFRSSLIEFRTWLAHNEDRKNNHGNRREQSIKYPSHSSPIQERVDDKKSH